MAQRGSWMLEGTLLRFFFARTLSTGNESLYAEQIKEGFGWLPGLRPHGSKAAATRPALGPQSGATPRVTWFLVVFFAAHFFFNAATFD